MTRAIPVLEQGTDTRAAALRASRKATTGWSGPALVWVFATDNHDPHEVLLGILDGYPGATVVGCSAPGVLACDRVTHDGIAVLALQDPDLSWSVGVGPGVHDDPRGAASLAARQAMAGIDQHLSEPGAFERTVLVSLPDAIQGNSAEVVRGLDSEVGVDVRLCGGGSGDDLRFIRAWQFAGDRVVDNSVVVVALAHRAPIGVGLRHGCAPWGRPMTVTRSSGRLVQDLDWRPAFDQYRATAEAVGGQSVAPSDFVPFAMLHPIGIAHGDGHYILRSPLSVADDGAIGCCSDVPSNGVIRVMAGSPETLLDAAEEAGRLANEELGGREPSVCLVFACVSRDFVLSTSRDQASAELGAIRRAVGPDVPLFGCLTFGQIGALDGGSPQFHSKSVQVCALPRAA